MTALAAVKEAAPSRKRRPALHAVPESGYLPRLAPPRPKRSAIAEYRKAAKLMGIKLFPWQTLAAEYMTALYGKRWRYPELAVVVGRQNGKTQLLLPRVVMGLLRGERIMHTAQDRALPRDVFVEVADFMEREFRGALRSKPRLANGTEQIVMLNGGRYRIVAPSRGGARGPSNDLVIVDEAREMKDHDFVGAAQPTLTVSSSPQMIYLSNAGTDESLVLNGLRARAQLDPTMGYLEWSAHEDRPIDDRTGWREANPSLAGGLHAKAHMDFLERMYKAYTDDGHPEIFETEHLCRWVTTELPRIVPDVAWDRARGTTTDPERPAMGIAQDPSGRRASAAIAWMDDGIVNVYVLADVDGYPVDLATFADEVLVEARRLGIRQVAYDSWTDRDLARYFPKYAKPMQMSEWEAAGIRFARSVESGQLRYDDPDGVLTADMAHTVRRNTNHAWIATRASDERPTTASFAAIRAVWLATNPAPAVPRVY